MSEVYYVGRPFNSSRNKGDRSKMPSYSIGKSKPSGHLVEAKTPFWKSGEKTKVDQTNLNKAEADSEIARMQLDSQALAVGVGPKVRRVSKSISADRKDNHVSKGLKLDKLVEKYKAMGVDEGEDLYKNFVKKLEDKSARAEAEHNQALPIDVGPKGVKAPKALSGDEIMQQYHNMKVDGLKFRKNPVKQLEDLIKADRTKTAPETIFVYGRQGKGTEDDDLNTTSNTDFEPINKIPQFLPEADLNLDSDIDDGSTITIDDTCTKCESLEAITAQLKAEAKALDEREAALLKHESAVFEREKRVKAKEKELVQRDRNLVCGELKLSTALKRL